MLNIKKVEFKDIDTAKKNIDLNSVHYKYKEIPAKLFKSKKIELIYINKEEIFNLINEFISTLSKSFNIGRLSFGNEDELYDKLKLKKGSVTPLGIINDNSSVILIIDKTLKGKKILTHPNINTATVSIRYDDLIKFIKYCNNTYYEV